MFVHVYSGFSGFPILRKFGPEDVLYHFAADVLGRSSVPLLTIISGWLFARSGKAYSELIKGKVRSLLVPLILWNVLALSATWIYEIINSQALYPPVSVPMLLNGILALWEQPVNLPLGFLRDLFVVMLISPLVVLAIRTFGGWALLPLFLFAVLVPNAIILLRTQILFFFAMGVWLHRTDFRNLPRGFVIAMGLWICGTFTVSMFEKAHGVAEKHSPLLENIDRIAVAGIFWSVAMLLARSPGTGWMKRLEPYAFLAFCSHFIVFRLLSVICVPVFGDLRFPFYPVYFLLQPVLGFVAAVAIVRILQPFPELLGLLNGGKVARPLARRQESYTKGMSTRIEHDD